jgi:hypothetical protein
VPRRAWHGQGLTRWHAQLFAEGLEHARRHAQRFGHLALAHTGRGVVEGFDLGRWLARRRADAASLTVWQTAQLVQLDPWWNPPWSMDWQRAWHRARAYAGEHGLVHGGDNLGGLPRWLELWLRRQITRYAQLHEGQQRLLAELGLTSGEVQRFQAWPGRRRPVGEAFALARAYAARHGHLAVPGTVTINGFALGAWLTAARGRQRSAGRPTWLGQRLGAVDARWNPPWPITWQRMWWAARHHMRGLPDGVQWWPGAPNAEHAQAWLCQQYARGTLLQPGQQQLLDELMLPAGTTPVWQPRISDTAWQTLMPLLPARPPSDGRYRSERQILEAIVHVACTQQSWPQLPQTLGSYKTCRLRYIRWRQDGTLARIATAHLPATDRTWQTALTRALSRYTAPRSRPTSRPHRRVRSRRRTHHL